MSNRTAGMTRRTFSRRAVASGLALSPLAAALGSCGGSGSGAKSGNLQFWKFTAENDDPSIAAAVKQWNAENPDLQVDFQTFPVEQYTATKLTTAFAGGSGPDVFWVSPGTFVNYVNQGIAAPLDDIVDKASYNQAAVSAVSADGKLYALPFEQEPVGLYYRTDLLEKAGVQPPQTWDDLTAAATELTGGKQRGLVIEPAPGPYQNFTWYPFLWSAGGEVVDASSEKSAFASDAAASALDLWGGYVRDEVAAAKYSTSTSDIGPLGRGEAAMQVCGFWAIAQMKNAYADVPYDVVRLPVPAGGEPTTVYGGWTQMVNSRGRVDEAKRFTQWLWERNAKFAQGWACGKTSKFSPNPKVEAACESVFDKGTYKVFQDDIYPTARAEPRYPDQVVKAVTDALQAVMFSGTSGEEAASTAAGTIDDFLSSYDGVPLNPTA